MELLKEIKRVSGLKTEGPTIIREAVRGIILHDHQLLMIHSTLNGDFKFPGGGCQTGETHQQTLKREFLEECGAEMLEFGDAFGKVIEYDLPQETNYALFKMTSYYYFCQVNLQFFEQTLDDYEAALGFAPVWIKVEDAIRNNQNILQNGNHAEIFWLNREIYILHELQKHPGKPHVTQKRTENAI
ncbi:MAG: NUDIX domain-containing protein [Chloroflexota bacterium]